MAHGDPVDDRMKQMLQSAVQSVQWTVLVWRDGYYNGAIKTRRTVQSVEVSAEEVALSRSDQLRELYDSLASGEQQLVENQQAITRRPSVALSPEDLTESEWFYLMCVSFSFPPGVGLVGDAYAKQQHVWLTGANDVDSKVYTRTILAKSAHIQTVICIPLLNGVVELGTTEKVQETNEFIEHVKLFFMNSNEKPILPPPKPTLSSHSSNTTLSPHQMPNTIKLSDNAYTLDEDVDIEEKDDEDDDDEEEEEEDAGDNEVENIGDDEDDNGRNEKRTCHISRFQETSGLLQFDMSRDIKLVSPNDGSNNLDSQFNFLATSIDDSLLASTPGWLDNFELHHRPYNIQLHTLEHLAPEDTHYSHTVSTIIHNQLTRRSNSHTPHHHPSLYSTQSSFATWTPHHHHHHRTATATAQRLLKSILFTVPRLHSTANASAAESVASQPPKTTSSHDDLTSASHVIAERRRREKINERFIVLRTLVPLVTKMDKASILEDTIEYVKLLRRKVRDLEAVVAEKRTVRAAEDGGGGGGGGGGTTATVVVVEVSIIEDDALVEVKCGYREGLLLDVMKKLRDVGVEVTTVESTADGGLFTAQMRAKVKVRKGNNGKKISITQVKTAIDQIISPSKINFKSSGLGKSSY